MQKFLYCFSLITLIFSLVFIQNTSAAYCNSDLQVNSIQICLDDVDKKKDSSKEHTQHNVDEAMAPHYNFIKTDNTRAYFAAYHSRKSDSPIASIYKPPQL